MFHTEPIFELGAANTTMGRKWGLEFDEEHQRACFVTVNLTAASGSWYARNCSASDAGSAKAAGTRVKAGNQRNKGGKTNDHITTT
jgi:hypothetical protein